MPGTPRTGSNARTTGSRVPAAKILWRRLLPMSCMAGRTTHRSSGMAVARMALKSRSAIGNSSELTQTGQTPALGQCTDITLVIWVHVGEQDARRSLDTDDGPHPARMPAPSPGQPASTSVQPGPELTR
jgi:hypothetical protein